MLHTHLPQLLGCLVTGQFETDGTLVLLRLAGSTHGPGFRKTGQRLHCWDEKRLLTSDGLILMKKLLRL